MFGFDDGRRPYRQVGQSGTPAVQGATDDGSTREGFFGFFARMFSPSSYSARSSSTGYVRPSTTSAGAADAVVLCQPVEGVACQPVEGIACQPVTMVPVLGPQQ